MKRLVTECVIGLLLLWLACVIAFLISRPWPDQPIFSVPPGPEFNQAGYQLILDYEVGGGQRYYERNLSHPSWPGLVSGVTIGVGDDLGYKSKETFLSDWHKLPYESKARLAATTGYRGQAARQLVRQVRDIEIPWKTAKEVFDEVTIPRFWQLTRRAFPGVEALHPEAQWALLSLVFNRGSDMSGTRRREMREIRDAVERQDYAAIAAANRASIRIWRGTSIERGMTRRRLAESELIES